MKKVHYNFIFHDKQGSKESSIKAEQSLFLSIYMNYIWN